MPFWMLGYDTPTRWLLWAWLPFFMTMVVMLTLHLWEPAARKWTWKVLLGMSVVMLVLQPYWALYWSPPERYMGEVYRILYVHYPQIAVGMFGFTLNFGCSVAYLFKKSWVSDSLAEASATVGVYFAAVGGLMLGSIWAKPTFGTWWTDDPRLNSTAVMVAMYVGYVVLRRFVEDPEKRATWSAVVGILAGASVPLVYLSVKARSIHQDQSNPRTVDSLMVLALRWSLTMFFCIFIVLIYQRYLHAQALRSRELAAPDLLDVPAGSATP